ncbi:Ribonuclease P protein subunit Rpp29/RNP1, partial [Dillenia turbinata]
LGIGSYLKSKSEQFLGTMAIDSTVDNQRKRTLEALERRLAAAKAELDQQQQFKNKTEVHKDEKATNSSGSFSAQKNAATYITQPTIASSRKDVEADGLAYSLLSQPVHENLLKTSVKASSKRGSTADKILHNLLQTGDVAQKYMQGSRSMKYDNWILLDNLVQRRGTSNSARVKALQHHSKRSKRHMSMKQHKKCGSLSLPREYHKFEFFKPMHEMWESYVNQLIKNMGKKQLCQSLLTADLHGAYVQVVDCKIATFAGVSGIMIRETAETFGFITPDDKFRVVPKKASVFMFQAESWKITLHGDKLASRNLGVQSHTIDQ